MISAPNRLLPSSNVDLHDFAGRTEVPSYTSDSSGPVLKPTIDSDGNWTTTPASSIDGMDKRVVRAALLTGQLSVSDLMEPEEAENVAS